MKVIMECNILLPDEEGRKRPYSCREVVITSASHYENVLKKWCKVLEWDEVKKAVKKSVKKTIEPIEESEEEPVEKPEEESKEKIKRTIPKNKQVITSKGKK